MFSNEDTHPTHGYQSVFREEVTVGHLQIATVSKGIDWAHRCIPCQSFAHTGLFLSISSIIMLPHHFANMCIYVCKYMYLCISNICIYVKGGLGVEHTHVLY
jgi:hypothetical protein